jgi:hypothetical protein
VRIRRCGNSDRDRGDIGFYACESVGTALRACEGLGKGQVVFFAASWPGSRLTVCHHRYPRMETQPSHVRGFASNPDPPRCVAS